MNYWIDTHAHIYAKEFDHDRNDMLARCDEEEVKKIYMPNVDHTTIDRMLEVESRAAHCVATMGLHPVSVKKDFERELYLVEEWLSKRRFAAIGEIGTDLYWDKTFWNEQCEAFKIQVDWARKFSLPVIIHCRESLTETIGMIEQLQDGKLTGIFHCFTGSVAEAERICKLNFYVGIGGVATFKKGGLDDVLPAVPMDRIVLETDSPYLAPVPHRGKRNEPAYVKLVAEEIAALKNVSYEEVAEATMRNANRLFQLH